MRICRITWLGLLALVAAGRLAQLRQAAFDVEDIIDDLKREAQMRAGGPHGVEPRR